MVRTSIEERVRTAAKPIEGTVRAAYEDMKNREFTLIEVVIGVQVGGQMSQISVHLLRGQIYGVPDTATIQRLVSQHTEMVLTVSSRPHRATRRYMDQRSKNAPPHQLHPHLRAKLKAGAS